jgi:hypothetical protein
MPTVVGLRRFPCKPVRTIPAVAGRRRFPGKQVRSMKTVAGRHSSSAIVLSRLQPFVDPTSHGKHHTPLINPSDTPRPRADSTFVQQIKGRCKTHTDTKSKQSADV